MGSASRYALVGTRVSGAHSRQHCTLVKSGKVDASAVTLHACAPAGGPDSSDRPSRSPVRDLNLSYALAETHSPDMPIFGRTSATPLSVPPATQGTAQQTPRQQQPQQLTPRGQGFGAAAAEDSTGELYSSLIHSNMQGAGCRAGQEGTPEAEGERP
jgi:hypothetical protein